MILRDALDIRRGTAQRNKIYKGTYKVWDRNKKALEGYCKQNTTEGKNKLKLENVSGEKNGITYNWEGTKLTLNGTSTQETDIYNFGWWGAGTQDQDRLLQAGTYIFSIQGANNINKLSANCYTNKNGNNILVAGVYRTKNYEISELAEATYYSNCYISIPNNTTFDNEVFYFQLESGNSVTPYEPYTGGQPSPNPDYPQEIEVMQGRQVVNIKNNNYCFTKVSDWKIGQYNTEGAIDDTSTIGLKRIRLNGLIPVPQDTQLYFDTFLNPYQLVIRGYDNNKNFVGSYGAVPNKTILNTSGRGIKYLGVSIFNSSGEETTGQTILDKIQSGEIKPFICLNSEEDKSFKPYKNEQYTVDLKSKQLFDANDIYEKISLYRKDEDDYITIEFDNSKGTTTKYFNYYTNKSSNLKLDTKYYIATEIKEVSGTGTISIASTYQTQSQIKNSISYDLSDLKNNDIKVDETTTVSDFTERVTMIRTFVKAEAGQKGSITFRLSVLEEQPTVENFNYEPYYDYKLAGIGDYKDNFYTDKGKWYFKQNIGKYLANNDLESNGEQTNRISLLTPILNVIPNNSTTQYKSNLMLGDITNNTGMNGTTGSKKIRVVLSKEYASNHSEASTFLTNKKMQIYFPFEIPTVTEIPSTYTTLINQLNTLYQAM